MKYKTIQGREITGDVINRYTKIMSVAGDDGRNYVCWLVGDPAPLKTHSIMPTKKDTFKGIEQIKCRVIKPNGECRTFQSIGAAANHYRTDRSTVSRNCDSEKPMVRGRLKGYKFERLS